MKLKFKSLFAPSSIAIWFASNHPVASLSPPVNPMNAQPKKNIPVQFLKFVVDADNMIIPITHRDKEQRPVSWSPGKAKLFQKQPDEPSR
jgi:hypothetical protein